jgi:hypothetical protein
METQKNTPSAEPRCYRCKRLRPSSQLVIAFRTKGATLRRCIDEQECDEYQLEQKGAA